MALSQQGDQGLPGWNFTLEETSNGAWRASGEHFDGRSASRTGSDEAALLRECVSDARSFPAKQYASETIGKYGGMTVNERLVIAGLMDAWDVAVSTANRERMVTILSRVELEDQAEKIADSVLANLAK